MSDKIRGQVQSSLRGQWVGGTDYTFFDAVLYNEAVYYALRDNNGAQPDISPQDWVSSDSGGIGRQGPQGEKGEKGEKGDTGAQGIQGEKGEKGDTGEKGETGEKGDTGNMPAHIWEGTTLSFETPDGSYSTPVDLKGASGIANLASDEEYDEGITQDKTPSVAQVKGHVSTMETRLDALESASSLDMTPYATTEEVDAATNALDTRIVALEEAPHADLSDYAKTADMTTALAGKTDTFTTNAINSRVLSLENAPDADMSAYATKEYVDTAVGNIDLANLKGRVDTVDDLPAADNVNGDIWLVGLATDDNAATYIYFEDTASFEQIGNASINGVTLATDQEYAAGTETTKAPSVAQVKTELNNMHTRVETLESAPAPDLSPYATTASVNTVIEGMNSALADKADTTVTDDIHTRLEALESSENPESPDAGGNPSNPNMALYATKTYVDTTIDNLGVMRMAGRVDTIADLPTENNKNGDVYLVGAADDTTLDQYVYVASTGQFEHIDSVSGGFLQLATDDEWRLGTATGKAPSVRQVTSDLLVDDPDYVPPPPLDIPYLTANGTPYVDTYAVAGSSEYTSAYAAWKAAGELQDSYTQGAAWNAAVADAAPHYDIYFSQAVLVQKLTFATVNNSNGFSYSVEASVDRVNWVEIVESTPMTTPGSWEAPQVFEVDLQPHISIPVQAIRTKFSIRVNLCHLRPTAIENITSPNEGKIMLKEQIVKHINEIQSIKSAFEANDNAGRYTLVPLDAGTTAATLTPNTCTSIASTVTSLSITLPAPESTQSTDTCLLSFTSGATTPVMAFSDNVLVPDTFAPAPEKIYELAFRYNHLHNKWLMLYNVWNI